MRIDAVLNKILLLCFIIALSACSPKASQVVPESVQPFSLSSMEVGSVGDGSLLSIKATESLAGNYTLIKLSVPPKVVIEMPKVDVGKFDGTINVANGVIDYITTTRLNEKGVRIEIGLVASLEHEVKAEGNKLDVLFAAPPAGFKESIEKSEAAPAVSPQEKAGEEKAAATTDVISPSIEKPSVPAVAEPKKEEKVDVAKKDIMVSDVVVKKVGDLTQADIIVGGEPSSYNVFNLKSPDRVVIDLKNVRGMTAKRDIKVLSSHIKGIRLARHDEQVRVVFDYKGSIQPYEVVKGNDRISILFGKIPAVSVAKVEKAAINGKDSAAKEDGEKKTETSSVGAAGAIIASAELKPETKEAVPVAMGKVEVKDEKAAPESHPEVKEELKASVKEKAATTAVVEAKTEDKAQSESEKMAKENGITKVYSGQKVTLEFKDADIKNIFRIIAEISGNNMIIDNAVTGKVTVRLVNVPWDQALDIVLETNNLGMKKMGNVIRVLPISMIKKEEEDKQVTKKTIEKFEDLVTKNIPINYAKATDVSSQVQKIMTDRGKISVDDRTNTIILTDIQKVVDRAEELKNNTLDRPTKQVSIEARIVTATSDFSKSLGVSWSPSYVADASHGNPTGYYFPNSYSITGAAGGSGINIPTTGSDVKGAYVGFNLGSINNTLNLDLRLAALESQGHGKVISSPKIVTLDNKEASIETGTQIAYQSTSSSGTKTEFVSAALKLQVTPHITEDTKDGKVGKVGLKITVNKDEPNFANNPPSIYTNKATTELLVIDGETTVIGGIYITKKEESESGVPFLRSLPLIGWLFRTKTSLDHKEELLIFITPRIIHPNAT